MLRKITGARILLILVTFFVAISSVHYHSYRSDATTQPSLKKPYYDNKSSDPVDGPVKKIMEPVDAEDDGNTEQNSGKIMPTVDEKDDETNSEKSEHIKSIISEVEKVAPLIKVLNLKGETVEEIMKEIYVDFSTLDTSAIPQDERMRAKVIVNLQLNAFGANSLRKPAEKLHPSDRTKYDLRKFNNGIVALGVENFMKAATQFCEEEAAAGKIPIVSIGSGDGTVEKEIIAQYRERFGKEIRIQLVDPDPKFDGIVDFKTVDHLIAENPRIVGNCVAFIIWPNPVKNLLEDKPNEYYDIEAIRKLQPKALLTVYESTGGSGSNDFRIFLHDDSLDDIPAEEFGSQNWLSKFHFWKKESYGLDNYAVLEVARQKITLPRIGTFIPRMVKIIRRN